MCAVAIPIIALALAAAGTAVTVDAQNKQAKYQTDLAQTQEDEKSKQDQNAMNAGAQQEEQQRWKVRQLIGSQTAAFGANGVDSSTGTPLDILGESAQMGEVDVQRIRDQTAQNSYGIQSASWDIDAQNKLNQASASNRNTATILGGASQMASSSYNFYGKKAA